MPTDAETERLSTMRARLDAAMGAYSASRQNELDDLRFHAGSPDNNWQWPGDVLSDRGGASSGGSSVTARPTLTLNKLPQHVRQVTNEQRQNRPSGKVIPVDDTADVKVAELFDGLIRHIEYISDADVAYDTACENQVIFGEGYIRLLTEYCRDDSFDQDVKIGRVRNPFAVYMDPAMQDPCGADAEWCFICEDLPRDEYERQFPDAAPVSTLLAQGVGDSSMSRWLNQDTVRIAEYFHYEYEPGTLNLYPGNQTAFSGTPEDRMLALQFGQPVRKRKVDRRKVMWVKTNGYEELRRTEWPGKWIPVVRVVGNEYEVDGELHVSGLVRNAKDAQRMYNYWTSQEAEMLALAPKAPFIGYGGQFEGYEDKWKTANTTNWPYLEVNTEVSDGNGNPLPLPQRALPPMPQTAIIQAKLGAADDIKGTTGQYDASLGIGGNERSGKAILAREKQGDTGTYHYVDNFARAVRYVTRQIVDIIPRIYDTQRIARIVGVGGDVDMARIDPEQPDAVREIKDEAGNLITRIYNPGVGQYDVMVTTGPGYMTKRQEALESMSMLLQTNTDLWGIIGDLFVKNMDWPGAIEISERLKRWIAQQNAAVLGDDENPQMKQAMQMIEALQGELQQATGMIESIGKSFEAQELKIKEFEAEIKAYDAETKRISAVQSGMTPEQIQDIAMGTIDAAIDAGDISPGSPEAPELAEQEQME